MGRRKKFTLKTDPIFIRYFNRLSEIAMSRFQWNNLPDTCDKRFLEWALFNDGMAVFFMDIELGGYLALQTMIGGQLTVYRVPKMRTAYAPNGYNNTDLNDKNSVIIFNNYMRTNDVSAIEQYAIELTELEYSFLINCKAQKTPLLLQSNEKQMVSLLNLYESYDGNSPVIFGDKSSMGEQPIKAISTGAPFVADRIYDMKARIWNEALTYLGIPNISENKKERMITDEVERQNGGTLASRNSALEMRRQACDEINKMFGLNISVDFRDGTKEFSQLNSEKVGEKDDSLRES